MPEGNLQQLSSLILRERERAGLSLRRLAERSGIAASTLFRIENGESERPDLRTLQAIARGLGIDVEELYASAGYFDREGLPELRPYLRAKYGIAGDAANRIEGYVQALRDDPSQPQQPSKEEQTHDHERGDTNP